MRFTIRDGLWLVTVLALATYVIVEHRSARARQQALEQKQAELAAAQLKQTELNANIAQMQTTIDQYENHGELIRRFLLMPLKPQ